LRAEFFLLRPVFFLLPNVFLLLRAEFFLLPTAFSLLITLLLLFRTVFVLLRAVFFLLLTVLLLFRTVFFLLGAEFFLLRIVLLARRGIQMGASSISGDEMKHNALIITKGNTPLKINKDGGFHCCMMQFLHYKIMRQKRDRYAITFHFYFCFKEDILL
jgi:hypothetical protein